MKKVFLTVTNDLVIDQRVHKVSVSLTKAGYDVTLVGVLKKLSKPLKRPYKTIRLPLIFNKGFLFYAEYNLKLFFYLLFKKVDILVANDLDTLLPNYLVSIIRKKKLLFDAHEYFTEIPELINRKITKRVWLQIEQFILPKVQYSYTVCESIANEYKKKYNVDMKIIMNLPISKKKYFNNQLTLNDNIKNKKIIIYQGALNIGRGIDLMIKAMKHLENTVFLIVGDGTIRNELIDLALQEQVSEKVVFTGRIAFDELSNYTQKADIGISLEENMGLNYYFSLPNKLFDYINAEIPILASNLPEIKKIVLENQIGEIVQDRSPENIANTINSIFNDASKIKTWKHNLKLIRNKYNWENQEETLLSIYR